MEERVWGGRRSPLPVAAPRRDVYWLRAVALAALFCYHCGRFFDLLGQPAGTAAGPVLPALTATVGLWAMPLLFTASGAAAAYAVRRQSAGRYVVSYARRLLVPMAFGLLTLTPLQVLLERLVSSRYAGASVGGIREWLAALSPIGSDATFSGRHLWLLLVLFAYSVLLVPVLWASRSRLGRRIQAKVVAVFAKPAMLLVLALPLMAIGAAARRPGIGAPGLDAWSLAEYLVVFVYGYFLLGDARVRAAIGEVGPYVLLLAILGTPTALYVWMPAGTANLDHSGGSMPLALVGLMTWCWVLSFLYVGQTYMMRDGAVLHWLTRAATPFYVLHLPLIVAVGYGVAHWGLSAGAAYAAIATISLVAILALCELAVRRVSPLRTLLGFTGIDGEDAPTSTMPARAR